MIVKFFAYINANKVIPECRGRWYQHNEKEPWMKMSVWLLDLPFVPNCHYHEALMKPTSPDSALPLAWNCVAWKTKVIIQQPLNKWNGIRLERNTYTHRKVFFLLIVQEATRQRQRCRSSCCQFLVGHGQVNCILYL